MAEYPVHVIAEIIGKSEIKEDYVIRNLITDSRKIVSPANSMFFAIKGERHDGHDFIQEVCEKGIRTFVVSEERNYSHSCPEANFIYTKNTLKALQDVAAWHRKNTRLPVVAITGSNGKTIIKEWIYHCLYG
ncbi:MAG: hypothetical protein HC906_00630 [Bacteroidales bacterium]|nr:hypothetical protein [Bacteroidales bacterium]